MLLIGGFAVIAVTLAIGGLDGVMAYVSSQRRHEIGVRIALGATTVDAMRLVMSEGLRVTATGIAIGLSVAGVVTQLMSAKLFQVKTIDPATYVGASLMLAVAAAVACAVPAFRASRVDPTTTLRSE